MTNDEARRLIDAGALQSDPAGLKKRRVGEETARTTISMMRSLAKNVPISPFHLAAADDMEALLNEVLKYRKERNDSGG